MEALDIDILKAPSYIYSYTYGLWSHRTMIVDDVNVLSAVFLNLLCRIK